MVDEPRLTMREFANATGRTIEDVKQAVWRGDIPTTPGRPLYRDADGQMQFVPLIVMSEIDRHTDTSALKSREIKDPRYARAQVIEDAAAKRAKALLVEARDPEGLREAAEENLATANEQARRSLRQIFGLPAEDQR